jgi:hypothetical protein
MHYPNWISNLTEAEVARAVEVISRVAPRAIATVKRRGRSKRPWLILLNGTLQVDARGRPRRFKTRRAASKRADTMTGAAVGKRRDRL